MAKAGTITLGSSSASRIWHVVRIGQRGRPTRETRCGRTLDSARFAEVDERAVATRGRPVCDSCRRLTDYDIAQRDEPSELVVVYDEREDAPMTRKKDLDAELSARVVRPRGRQAPALLETRELKAVDGDRLLAERQTITNRIAGRVKQLRAVTDDGERARLERIRAELVKRRDRVNAEVARRVKAGAVK